LLRSSNDFFWLAVGAKSSFSDQNSGPNSDQNYRWMAEMAAEIGVQRPVGAEPEELADDLNRQHLAVR
jgi:hypothetical protein